MTAETIAQILERRTAARAYSNLAPPLVRVRCRPNAFQTLDAYPAGHLDANLLSPVPRVQESGIAGAAAVAAAARAYAPLTHPHPMHAFGAFHMAAYAQPGVPRPGPPQLEALGYAAATHPQPPWPPLPLPMPPLVSCTSPHSYIIRTSECCT